jgi:NAD-dependent DNA ligase
MMNPDQVAERFEDLTFEILFHKYLYFEHEKPAVSDEIYHSLREEYRRLGNQLGYQLVSFSPCFHFSHGHPLAKRVCRAAKDYLGFE